MNSKKPKPLTAQDLELVKLKAQVLALENVVGLILAASTRSEAARQQLIEVLRHSATVGEKVRFPHLDPVSSDLYAAEARDAAQALADYLIAHLEARS